MKVVVCGAMAHSLVDSQVFLLEQLVAARPQDVFISAFLKARLQGSVVCKLPERRATSVQHSAAKRNYYYQHKLHLDLYSLQTIPFQLFLNSLLLSRTTTWLKIKVFSSLSGKYKVAAADHLALDFMLYKKDDGTKEHEHSQMVVKAGRPTFGQGLKLMKIARNMKKRLIFGEESDEQIVYHQIGQML